MPYTIWGWYFTISGHAETLGMVDYLAIPHHINFHNEDVLTKQICLYRKPDLVKLRCLQLAGASADQEPTWRAQTLDWDWEILRQRSQFMGRKWQEYQFFGLGLSWFAEIASCSFSKSWYCGKPKHEDNVYVVYNLCQGLRIPKMSTKVNVECVLFRVTIH